MSESDLALNSATYSDRQLAVAQTWAEHFRIEPKHQQAFIRSYLDNTRHTGFWTFPLPALQTPDLGGASVTPVLARLSSELQFFDGHLVWAVNLSVGATRDLERDLGGPQALAEGPNLEQAQRLIAFVAKQGCRHRPGLLTAFSKAARDLLFARAAQDVAPWAKLVTGERWEARYCRPRAAFYGKHLGAALKRFNAHLDPEVLRLIRGIRCPDSRLYNWICEPQGNRAWRLQAVRAQPVLLPMLVLWPEELTAEQRTVPIPRRGHCPWPVLAPYVHGESLLLLPHLLGLAVDQALPLHEVLAWLFQVPVAHLRYLGRQRVYDTGGALSFLHPEDNQRAFRILLGAASTGNRRPQSQADWKAFRQFWHQLPYLIQFQRDLTHFIKGGPQHWSDPAWFRLGVRTEDLSELHEGLEGDHPLHTLIEQFRVQRSAVEIARLADRYQTQRRALIAQHRAALQAADLERYGAPDTPKGWPGLLLDCTAVTAPNGLEIVELLTPEALHLEHYAMNHCVDQYDYAALSGHCRLFSVRRAGTSLATAEIVRRQASLDDDDLTLAKVLKVQQLRAYGNDPLAAGSAEQQAWDWFWQQLLRGRWSVRLDWPYLVATDEYALEQQAFERSLPALVEWLEHQLRDVTHEPLSSLSALEVCPMGLRYARDLHHFAESACLDELMQLVRPLQDWSAVFTPGLACFAQRIFTSSHESVHPKQIVGYAARDHAGMSWKRLLLEGGKMAENLAWLERNPRYYFDGSAPGEQPEPIQLATLDGLEFYVVGQGLHRACIARLLVELHADVVLRNVKVTRYDLRQDLIQLCDRFNARMQALAVAPRIRPFDLGRKELVIRGGKLETYELALLIELSDTTEWVVDVSMAERFLAEVEAARGRQPAIRQTLTVRMMSRLLAKIRPLAVIGGLGRG